MKTFVLTVSRHFPTTHKRKGEETFFPEFIKSAIGMEPFSKIFNQKIHTIRSNKNATSYERWAKKVKEIQEGKAILSIRYWSGKPYNSKQVEICQLDKDSGIGVQKIDFSDDYLYSVRIDGERHSFDHACIAEHDGLSHEDFEEWFKGYDLSKPMAIIHFTSFRY
jgi:hypothetical protein